MLFALVAYDKPHDLKRRTSLRPEHLQYLEALGDTLVLAGPFLDEQGNMVGSFVVIEAETAVEAEAIFRSDPFMINGLFDSVTIKPYRISINNSHKK